MVSESGPTAEQIGKCTMLKSCTRDAVKVLITGHHACQQHYDQFSAYCEATERQGA